MISLRNYVAPMAATIGAIALSISSLVIGVNIGEGYSSIETVYSTSTVTVNGKREIVRNRVTEPADVITEPGSVVTRTNYAPGRTAIVTRPGVTVTATEPGPKLTVTQRVPGPTVTVTGAPTTANGG
jgi:hypothetical protein